mmetsp:Transcript_18198/g.23218  ORF Transcript_18198/g.23218 Transcript_18198/m.23218 type:complete len:195 (+) Transcript_18198:1-585(+)
MSCLQRDPQKRATIPEIMKEWDSILLGEVSTTTSHLAMNRRAVAYSMPSIIEDDNNSSNGQNLDLDKENRPSSGFDRFSSAASVKNKPVRTSMASLVSEINKRKEVLQPVAVHKGINISSLETEIKKKKDALQPLAKSNSIKYMKNDNATPEHKKNEIGYMLKRGMKERFDILHDGDTNQGNDTFNLDTEFTWS